MKHLYDEHYERFTEEGMEISHIIDDSIRELFNLAVARDFSIRDIEAAICSAVGGEAAFQILSKPTRPECKKQ